MKRGILVATLAMTMAGVASASLFTAASHTAVPQSPQAQPQARESVPAMRKAAVAEVAPVAPAPAPKVVTPVPVVQKVSIEARQAPVPLHFKSRPPVNLPAVDGAATEAKPADGNAAEPAAATDDTFSENAAKAAIAADGYKNVRMVRKAGNGVWQAKALRGNTEVSLTVDASGSVSAD